MSNLRPFQIVILALFGFFGIGALIFLGAYQSKISQEAQVYGDEVLIWGTLDKIAVGNVLQDISDDIDAFDVVQYEQIDESIFDETLLNAIAEDRSPDLIILSSEKLVEYRAKLIPIPYETYTQRTFRDTYVDGAEIFSLSDGTYALPFAVDPVVQFWNKDLLASNGLAQAPSTWEDVVNKLVPSVTIRDTSRNILQSAVAFGEYRNLVNAKQLLMLLTMQSGSQMVYENGQRYAIEIDAPIQEGARAPLQATLQFFTDFSNANSPLYSWNRGLQKDKNVFLSGDLAVYYGFGSEYDDIAGKNPNLSFDVAMVPQGRDATIKRTYGTFYGFAIPKASQNTSGAFAAMQTILNKQYADMLSLSLRMSSPRRDTIASGAGDPIRQVLLNSALIARGWLDPETTASDTIFMRMVEDVVSNRSRINEAVGDAVSRLILEY